MASALIVLLSLALACTITAAPTETPSDATTVGNKDKGDVPIVGYIKIVELIPAVASVESTEATDATGDVTDSPASEDHKLVKRSALRGDNPSNDLLANFDGLNYENGVSSFAGRRIRFLPTWLG